LRTTVLARIDRGRVAAVAIRVRADIADLAGIDRRQHAPVVDCVRSARDVLRVDRIVRASVQQVTHRRQCPVGVARCRACSAVFKIAERIIHRILQLVVVSS
jgi:hypothetical protein